MAKMKKKKEYEIEPETVDVKKRIQEYWQALEADKEESSYSDFERRI